LKKETECTYVIVPDTNVFLHNMQDLNDFHNKMSSILIKIPYVVIYELDRLHHNKDFKLKRIAQNAIKWIKDHRNGEFVKIQEKVRLGCV
jgi:rRNA-processing protein FCF1